MGQELSLALYVFNIHNDPKREVLLVPIIQIKQVSQEGWVNMLEFRQLIVSEPGSEPRWLGFRGCILIHCTMTCRHSLISMGGGNFESCSRRLEAKNAVHRL